MNHDKAADPLAQELIKSRVALRNRLAEKAQIPHIKVSGPQHSPYARTRHSNSEFIHFPDFAAHEQQIHRNIPDSRILDIQSDVCRKRT